MSDDASAKKAIAELDGGDVDGRTIKVMEAKPKEGKSGGGGYRGNGGNYNNSKSYNKNGY